MTTAATITANLVLDAAGFTKGIDGASKSADSFSTKMQNVGKGMLKVGGIMTAGITAPLVGFGLSSVQSAQDAENALADLQAVLKSTGGTAGVTLDELTANASALQKVTKFSDESVMSAQGMLLTFTNIGKDVFPAATEAALDMAQKFGMDASQASITLGKALNDPVAGVGALRRIGVQLTDEQEAQIKKFMEVGDVASAQKIIMGELATEIGGVAKAAGETTSGKFAQFNNQLDDMKERIGTALIPILLRFLNAITPLIEKFSNASPQMQKFIMIVVGIVAAIGPVISVIGGLVSGIGAIIPVVTAVGAALAPIAIPILAIIAAVALLYLAWKTNFFGIRDTITTIFAAIKLVFQAFQAAMNGDWTKFGQLLRQAWDLVWNLIEKRIQGAWTFIVNIAKGIVDGIKAAFTIDWSQLGTKIIQGIVNGLKAGVNWVVQAAQNVAQAAMDAVKGFLGIQSPSRVMFGFGEMTAKGFALGMAANNDFSIPKALTSSNTSVATSAPSGGAMMGGGQNITINIENPKKETAEESIRKTLKSLSYTGVIPS